MTPGGHPWLASAGLGGLAILLGAALWLWPAGEGGPVLPPGREAGGVGRPAPASGRGAAGEVAPAPGPGNQRIRLAWDLSTTPTAVAGTAAAGPVGEGLAASGAPGEPGPRGEPASEEERIAAEQLASELRRLARDLEFNAGLREPPQQVVARAPEPWRPEPVASGLPPPVIEQVSPPRGPAAGGAEVVLRGRNFRAIGVMFGTQAARITRASEEAVTVEVPRGRAGPVAIALTNDDGTFALAAAPFTYLR